MQQGIAQPCALRIDLTRGEFEVVQDLTSLTPNAEVTSAKYGSRSTRTVSASRTARARPGASSAALTTFSRGSLDHWRGTLAVRGRLER
jgi:hypothetical protein